MSFGSPTQTLYAVLAVCRGADNAQIRSAYRQRALQTHPDKGGSATEFLQVVEAFEVLSDAGKRASYDLELQRTGSQDGQGIRSNEHTGQPSSTNDAPSGNADVWGLPGVSSDVPLKPREGWGTTEETQRARGLWIELLEGATENRAEKVSELSCRAAEVLLTYARSHACAGGAPVVMADAAPDETELGTLPADREAIGDESHGMQEHSDQYVFAESENCGISLLAPSVRGAQVASRDQGGLAADCNSPQAKRRRLSSSFGTAGGGSRAWICVGRLKICTGASEDLAEAINWHILLVRIKQLYQELKESGRSFAASVRESISGALAERAAEGGGSDPRLRFVTECATPNAQVLFTPASWDLEKALRWNEELEALLSIGSSPEELLAAIRRMTVASEAADDEQRALVEHLEQHLRAFQKLLRWRGGMRPKGVNATLSALPAIGEEAGAKRTAFAYAELWRQRMSGQEQLEPLCRGPRRRRADEAIADLAMLQAAQVARGDEAAISEARRLYAQTLRTSMMPT